MEMITPPQVIRVVMEHPRLMTAAPPLAQVRTAPTEKREQLDLRWWNPRPRTAQVDAGDSAGCEDGWLSSSSRSLLCGPGGHVRFQRLWLAWGRAGDGVGRGGVLTQSTAYSPVCTHSWAD